MVGARSHRLTLVLAEDHLLVRRALRMLLESHDLEVVAETGDLPAARAAVQEHLPDVLLLDLGLPGGSTLSLLDELAGGPTAALILTADEDPHSVRLHMASGARGYVAKRENDAELLAAVRAVAQGHVHVSPALGAALVQSPQGRLRRLAPEDVDVLRLIALGYTAREMAETLNVPQRHVEWQRSRLQRQLEAPTRADLVRVALEEALVRRPLSGAHGGR
jgi:two-component system response regulator NreC